MTFMKRIVTELLNSEPHPYDDNPHWQAGAPCIGKTSLFFPERGTPAAKIREAKQYCRVCPIQQKCLDYALWHGDRSGIWGGKTEKERRNLKLRLDAAKPPRRKRITIEWVDNNEIQTD